MLKSVKIVFSLPEPPTRLEFLTSQNKPKHVFRHDQFEVVYLTAETQQNSYEFINLYVKEIPFTITFASKIRKIYIIESSADLTRWERTQIINGTGDTVEYKPTLLPDEKARFFRVRLNR